MAFVSPHGLKNNECYMCSAPVSPQGFKRDVYFIVARLFRLMALRTTSISCVAFVSPHGLKSDECYMCGALVSRHGLKNNECYICSALVSPHMCSALVSRHGFKNDVYFIVPRLFRLMT